MNGMKRRKNWGRKLLAAALSLLLAAGPILPAASVQAAERNLSLNNGYILTELTGDNGCFNIRTVDGDKVNKADNNKNLLFPNEGDATSFTSFQVTRDGKTEEYIFGGSYEGSSEVVVTQTASELNAVWSVSDLTFAQTLSLINSEANEHGMVAISYTVENAGAPAEIKARVLLDTALGTQDYAYYRVGTETIEQERALEYDKSFYCYDDPFSPKITAYLVNASLSGAECKPYQTIFAHWNNLAATAFDYTPDSSMTFTNFNNRKYLTADSACALYYDMGSVAQGSTGTVALNYGVYSNEKVTATQTATVNVTAPAAMELTANNTVYTGDGKFTVQTAIKNVSSKTYEKARIVLYTTGALQALDENGNVVETTYDNPYYREVNDFSPGQTQTITWNLQATPQAEGVYSSASFKVYDVSDTATQGTNILVADNLMGEGSAWVLCPGSVNKVPEIQFTGSSPDVLFSSGRRTLYLAGKNFSMLTSKGDYSLMLSRLDGQPWNGNGQAEVRIPPEKFNIDAEKNTLTVTMDDQVPGELPEGQYQLIFDYTDPTMDDLSAPALRFAVKQEEKYRNDTYGLLVAVKDGENTGSTYHIETFADEDAYEAALTNHTLNREDALLEFRGIFNKRTTGGTTVYTGTSSGSGDNVMTLNSCLDIEKGAVTITEKNGSVSVDFDASIYTTGSRTSVWKGVAALTELEKGHEYGLIQYDEDGDREDVQPANTITLLWPSVGQAAQNLLGFLMEFKYGELGVIHHDNADETRVVGFGAAMDLSFIIPSFQETADDQSLLDDAYSAAIYDGGYPSASELRELNDHIPYNVDTVNTNAAPADGAEEEAESKQVSGSIQIDDVLFGGSFLGVNMAVSLAVPAYIEGTPALEGTLTLKTVGDWAVGVAGSADFSVFCMEGEIAIKSRNNIPVPDTIHFFLGNCTPGICLDPCGVLWIQGAGGGIEDLYDTIFLTDSVPPLKLILDAQFSIMQIISARASLSLSLRGIGVTLTDGAVAGTLPVMDSARLQVDWYPEFYFLGSVQMDVMDVIKGGGYIVVEQSGFFEFFVNASVNVPGDTPIIGGMQVASVGLGANAEKIWGQLKALGVSLGVVYYWGSNSIEWGGGAAANPTYPELMGRALYRDIPVYTDSATGRTLYAAVGTNLKRSAATRLREGTDPANALIANGEGSYTLTLDSKVKDELLILEWPAASLAAASSALGDVTIKNGSSEKTLTLLDRTKPVEEQKSANTNLTFNKKTGTATLAVSFTDPAEFNKLWTITAPTTASVVLYDLEPMPELTRADVAKAGNDVTVTLQGTQLDKFDSIRFVAVKEGSEEATLVYQATKESGRFNTTQTFALPTDLPSGAYKLRVVANDENGQYHSEIVTSAFDHHNSNEPNSPANVTVEYAGDYKLDVSAAAPAGSFDGYRVDVYDTEGKEVEGVSGLLFTRDGQPVQYDENGTLTLPQDNSAASATMTVGGQYQIQPEKAGGEAKTFGLTAGQYRIEVSTWKQIPKGSGKVLLYSEAASLDNVTMREKAEMEFTFQADAEYREVTEEREVQGGEPITFTIPTYKTNNLTLTMTSSPEKVSGTWKLDGEEIPGGESASMEHTLSLTDLDEGTHTLEFTGKNESRDTVRATYSFGVDTLPPRLLLSSPMSGSFYDDDVQLTVEGITDPSVRMTIADVTTGWTDERSTVEIDTEGRFTETVILKPNLASHTLLITVTDAVGNSTQKTVELLSDDLGKIDGLAIYSGETEITNTAVEPGSTYPLTLVAKLTDGRTMKLNNDTLVEWRQTKVDGDAALTWEDGSYSLTVGTSDRGMVSAYLLGNDLGSHSAAFAYGVNSEEQPDTPQVTPTPAPTVTPTPTPTGNPTPAPAGSPTPSDNTAYYTLTSSAGHGGAISPDGTVSVSKGGSKTFTITPSEGYEVADVLVDGKSVGAVSSYTFEDVTQAHTIEVSFKIACNKNAACPGHPFTDLNLALWYHDGIHFCVERELMKGTSATTFSPGTNTTRAMVAAILWRLQGSPKVNYAMDYKDVSDKSWYTEAVRWASGEDVIMGYGNGRFGPTDPVTREQLAVILYRYQQKFGDGGFTNSGMFQLDFRDEGTVSKWAYEAMCWTTKNKIIAGKGGNTLDPKGKTTRAEAAAMFQRYIQKAEQ